METIHYKKRHLNTVSLFSGAGGLDLGFLNAGFNIIWANDFDKYAVESYKANIGDHINLGDIKELLDEVPPHDVLLAGFPCQPFSMMGEQKGFEDERGTLFFSIETLLKKHNTKIVVLENVKNLEKHDGGKTFAKMKRILEDDLGYVLFYNVLNSVDYGIPQIRRRLFVVGFKKEFFEEDELEFDFPPKTIENGKIVQELLDKDVEKRYFLSEKVKTTIMSTGTKNYVAKPEINLKIARPLCATMHKMHRASQDNYYTDDINRSKFEDDEKRPISNIRMLTPNECRKLQGFPSEWRQVVSNLQAYRQFGNAVTVNVAYYVAMQIVKALHINLEIEE
ncbi:DNA (cytosine-5-)-methyltransferase [Clostridium sp. ZBS3]|uniref:DNA cytosine methyltransferase n=1 Tax=Clostridium sp. ZBS3 TaxID=2949975 RepID=UPI0014018039|nr:DNA (cytosine-5-)-methyltransferase [Clostridium sp. ZBS3]NFI53320.1 DNA (cytosine-5-)-methyltransferase [Clostridium botulinum]